MFEIICVMLFGWLFIKALGLAFKLTWGAAKIIATILFVIALPSLIGGLLLAGGLLLIVPVGLVAIAAGVLKAAV